MKKKVTSVITMCMAASLIFTTSGAIAFASETEVEEETETVESGNEADELDWAMEQFDELSDILTGVEDKEYDAGTAHKYDIHMGVDADKDVVRGVLFNTSDIDFDTPGEYNVSYKVFLNREALLDYMEDNDINPENFPGLTDASSDRLMIAVDGKVTINGAESSEPVYEEPVYEEPVYEEPVYEEPVYEEPVYEEPVYEEPVYEEPVYEEPVYEEPAYEEPAGRTVVNVETIYDCDGSGHGYYIYHYSDGSEEYEDF